MRSRRARSLCAAYLLVEGLAIPAFWLALWLIPALHPWFIPASARPSTFAAFAAPDLLILAPAALFAARAVSRGSPAALPLLWAHAGAAAYAALYALLLAALEPAVWLGGALMAPLLVIPPLLAARCGPAAGARP